MNFSQLKDIAELIGLVAIVASLIFVGLQLKQSQEIALATQYQARAETTMNLSLVHLEAGYTPRIPSLRAGVSDEVSSEDINTYLWLWIAMDNHYYQYQAGFLSEEAWQAQQRNTKGIFADCPICSAFDFMRISSAPGGPSACGLNDSTLPSGRINPSQSSCFPERMAA